MIDLQNILRMIKANENDKPRYGNLVKAKTVSEVTLLVIKRW